MTKLTSGYLILLYQRLILSHIEYALAIPTISTTQVKRLEKMHNEITSIILGFTMDIPRVTEILAWRVYVLRYSLIQNTR